VGGADHGATRFASALVLDCILSPNRRWPTPSQRVGRHCVKHGTRAGITIEFQQFGTATAREIQRRTEIIAMHGDACDQAMRTRAGKAH
jgi:hypothetical protein